MTKILVLDVESTTYDKGNPFNTSNRLMCVGTLSNDQYTCYDIEYSNRPYNKSLRELRQQIEEADLLVGFNIKFDLHWIRNYLPDIKFPKIFDCQLAYFLLQNQTIPYPSLNACLQHYNLPEKLDEVRLQYWEQGIDTDKIPWNILETYCKGDCQSTYTLYTYLLKDLYEANLKQLHAIQCEDLLVLEEMEFNGLLFDTDQALALANRLTKEHEQTTAELNYLSGIDFINWNSPEQVSVILYGGKIKSFGVEDVKRPRKDGSVREYQRKCIIYHEFPRLVEPIPETESEETRGMSDLELARASEQRERAKRAPIQRIYSVDEDTLKQLKPKGKAKDIIETLARHSDQDKLISTYYQGLPNKIKEKNWRPNYIHGNLNQCVARTGRLSSSQPNLQNFDVRCKPLFPARNSVLINIDVKGLEWVAAMYLSQDKIGMQEILDGVDAHAENQKLYKLPSRLLAKRFNFRLIYGGSEYSYAHDPDFMGISVNPKFWKKVIDTSYSKYNGLWKWHSNLVREVVRSGMLVMPTGRRYAYSKKKNGDWPRTTILNYPVQGLGADILSLIRISLWKRLKKALINSLLVNTVHDSIVIDAYPQEVNKILSIVWSVFEDAPYNFEKIFKTKFNLPLRCEVLLGKNWGEMNEIKQGEVYAY